MDPSFIYGKRDQMDEELDRREPPLGWDEEPCPVCGGEVGHRINCPRGIAFTGEAAEARRTLPRPRLTEAQERARGELARRLAAGENISLGLFL